MTAKTFVDTNILLYAYDHDAGWKHEVCAQEMQHLWIERAGVISTQIMQEFYVNAIRKLAKPLTYAQARDELRLYEAWEVVQVNPALIQTASYIQEDNQLSFWDSLVVAAAQSAKAEVLLSEDLNHGQIIGGVRVHNPLKNQVQESPAIYKT